MHEIAQNNVLIKKIEAVVIFSFTSDDTPSVKVSIKEMRGAGVYRIWHINSH